MIEGILRTPFKGYRFLPDTMFPVSALRVIFVHFAVIAIFGVLIPWRKGLDFLDPVLIGAYSCLGVLFAAPASMISFERNRPKSLGAVFKQLGKAVGYGEVMALVFLAAGVATVSWSRGRLHLPLLDDLAATALLGLMLSIGTSLFAAWLTLHSSATSARAAIRFVLLLLIGIFFFGSMRLPDIALSAAAVMAIIAGLLIFLLRREIRQ